MTAYKLQGIKSTSKNCGVHSIFFLIFFSHFKSIKKIDAPTLKILDSKISAKGKLDFYEW